MVKSGHNSFIWVSYTKSFLHDEDAYRAIEYRRGLKVGKGRGGRAKIKIETERKRE